MTETKNFKLPENTLKTILNYIDSSKSPFTYGNTTLLIDHLNKLDEIQEEVKEENGK